MGCVVIRPKNTSRGKDLDRRLFVFHDMNLACRCLGTKQEFRGEIEGILHISCRVILWCIQCSKVVVIGLDFSSLVYLKAHACKDVDKLFADQGNRMKVSDRCLFCRKGQVDFSDSYFFCSSRSFISSSTFWKRPSAHSFNSLTDLP